MKPLILYVDDEPRNLTVFEAAMPDEWEVRTFDNPLAALQALTQLEPAVVCSDQRMPGMKGVDFLELVGKLKPAAVRIIVTAYSDEDLVIQSVRKAHVQDYIRKPWDMDDLVARLGAAIDLYRTLAEKAELTRRLEQQTRELTERTLELQRTAAELDRARVTEESVRRELECWAPPFLLAALKDPGFRFPLKRDLVGLTFDIIDSARLHGVELTGRAARSRILQIFSEAVLRNGGWRESHAGDSAYAHFGLLSMMANPAQAALAAAREFRVALRGMSQVHGIAVECGVALHLAAQCTVDLHTVQIQTPTGSLTQKSFDTSSAGVDLLHRVEKLVHDLPGSNIIMTGPFLDALGQPPENLVNLGDVLLKGQECPVAIHLLPSDRVTKAELAAFCLRHKVGQIKPAAA